MISPPHGGVALLDLENKDLIGPSEEIESLPPDLETCYSY